VTAACQGPNSRTQGLTQGQTERFLILFERTSFVHNVWRFSQWGKLSVPSAHMNTSRIDSIIAPLRRAAFQRLWLGLSISYLGDQFTSIALLWFVLQSTGSGAAVGLVILCFDLPGVVTGAILGRLLDRYQPRLVMGLDNLARAALIAAVAHSGGVYRQPF